MLRKVHPRDAATFWDKRWRLEHLYKIKTEDRKLKALDMRNRPVQEILYSLAEAKKHRGIRIINLKARKEGVTTFWGLYYLDDTLITPNTVSCILAHKEKDVHKIFNIVQTAYHNMPEGVALQNGRTWYKPTASYDNRNELVFNNINSMIYVGLESRGNTNNNLHVSEAHHIPNAEERMAASLESVPNIETGSNITIETTGNGVGGWFYDLWQDSKAHKNEFDPQFFPWFLKPSNRLTIPSDFYPTSKEQEMVVRVAETYGVILTPEQIFWHRQTSARQKRYMNQEHPTFDDDAFLFSGLLVFDPEVIKRIQPKEPIRILRNGTRIFVDPKHGRRYVEGADVAEGIGGDSSVGEIYDAVTLEQVAEYESSAIAPGEFAQVLADNGRLYNEALIAIERNNHGHTTIDRIKNKYTRLFMGAHFDERTQKRTAKIGWETNSHTRDLMLDEMQELIEDGTVKVNSVILKGELITFITNEDGKREAKSGFHDDTIMASAIAIKVARMPKSSYGVFEIN